MRYDDSPERDNIPMIFYVVTGNPSIDVVLHEELEPVGDVFSAIIVMDSSMLLHSTSQRASLFDGAKKNAVMVVNTSLSSEDVVGLLRKHQLSKNCAGKLVTIGANKKDKEDVVRRVYDRAQVTDVVLEKVVEIGELPQVPERGGHGEILPR